MATISVCMIVKNEEVDIGGCLDCFEGIADEIIVVDTGSTDKTKEIAARYTDKIFDFEWIGDFAAARNFAFSKASMDYIYSADADEIIDEENRAKLRDLKEIILPEIEIVQMIYSEEGEISTVLNSDSELRPKLYKRQRSFTWIDPVHETVRTLPVVFDSDIVIEHHPKNLHAPRDFSMIEAAYNRDGGLSKNLYKMYAREVYKWGDDSAIKRAAHIFENVIRNEDLAEDLFKILSVICAKSARISDNDTDFLRHVAKVLALGGCSEICAELSEYFAKKGDKSESELWDINAKTEECIISADVTD